MIDPTKVNMNDIPKKFCDGAIGSFGQDVFAFAISSGNTLDSFATTPRTMKSIAMWMGAQIKSYEEKFGEIDMTPPQIVSPLQVSDLEN